MSYKIRDTYKITKTHEFSLDYNNFNFLVIYGEHINGWFIAIPNWNICTEAGEPTDVGYNTTKIAQTHIRNIAPKYLAWAIKEHWNDMNGKVENKNR